MKAWEALVVMVMRSSQGTEILSCTFNIFAVANDPTCINLALENST